MILQSLNDYYLRKASDPQSGLAPPGFEAKAIPFVLMLDGAGRPVQIADQREGEGKKRAARPQLVPQGVKKTSGVAANLLWDAAGYVLGLDTRGKAERAIEQQVAFLARLHAVFGEVPVDEGLRAVYAFYAWLNEDRAAALGRFSSYPEWSEIVETNPLLSFQLIADTVLVCQRPAVIAALRAREAAVPDGVCLISGEPDAIERLHPSIKGVWGAQTAGANIVSFNLDAFNSYGKTQSFNAPVGQRATFAYTTALNHLLAKGSRQRIQVGDASTIFWAERASGERFEEDFLDFLAPPSREKEAMPGKPDNPDLGAQAVASLFASVRNGTPITDDDGQRFYVLGLAPNAARIAVRFWHVATIRALGQSIYRHFAALEIARADWDMPYLSLFRLLVGVALLGKAENIPPNLAGDTLRAILTGMPYPETLLQACMRRIRAEREVTYPRAALLKSYLIRNRNKEMTVSLNLESTDPGYRLGRLFAVLERVQARAHQGRDLNAGIRERYYGAFSATPVTVLPLLMKLKNHHLAKIDNRGEVVNLEKSLTEIIDGLEVNALPARLSLVEQACFALGYYHQRQASFAGKTDPAPSEQSTTDKE
jgi:CRISPR-associated protein Csd1